MILLYVCLHAILLYVADAHEWSYRGSVASPSKWHEEYPVCGGKSQSPIDIVTSDVGTDPNINTLRFTGYGHTLTGGTLVNNGHSVQVNFPSGKSFILTGDGLDPNTYKAAQLHFHWRDSGSTEGSEHTIDGKSYPAEMHIVHFKEPYHSAGEIEDMPDGLAVLGIMFDIGPSDNVHLQKIIDTLGEVTYAGETATVTDGPSLESLLPNSTKFYRYPGSLTTPPCYESVIWTILQQPTFMSKSQLLRLQSLRSVESVMVPKDSNSSFSGNATRSASHHNDSLGGNFRPVQPLNGRTVILSGDGDNVNNVTEVPPTQKLPILIIVVSTVCGLIAFIVMIAIVKRCCCKEKRKKSSASYKAGHRDAEEL